MKKEEKHCRLATCQRYKNNDKLQTDQKET